MRVVVSEAIQSAARFVSAAWRVAWAILALVSGALAAAIVVPPGARRWGWLVLALVLAVSARGALYRRAMNRGRPGPGGLQWGPIEWRLLVVSLLSFALLGILLLLVLVVVLCMAYAAASAGHGFDPNQVTSWAGAVDNRGRWVVSVIALAGATGLIWVAIRIALADAATVALGKVRLLAAWPLTRDLATAILLAAGLVGIGPALILLAVSRIAVLASPRGEGPLSWALAMVAAVSTCGLWLPLNVGLMSYFHRRADALASTTNP